MMGGSWLQLKEAIVNLSTPQSRAGLLFRGTGATMSTRKL
jgi:hypothetical protein